VNCYVIDREALVHNIEVIKERAGSAAVYGVLKGNAYGIDIVQMAKILADNGIDRFAVTEVGDAAALRNAGFEEEEILVIRSICNKKELEALLTMGAVCTAGSQAAALAIHSVAASLNVTAKVHIEIDTGMGRTGFLPGEFEEIKSVYALAPQLRVTGIYTHFHSAFSDSNSTKQQYERFTLVLDALKAGNYPLGTVHAANSSALFRCDYADFDAVRVGSALLGRLSFSAKNNCGLKKLGYIESELDSVRWLPAGSTLGYGAGHVLKKPAKVAIIPVGYYHGFNVSQNQDLFRFRDSLRNMLSAAKTMVFGKKLYVTVGEKKARVLGHVGMLHTAVDVTNIECAPGTKVKMEAKPLFIKDLKIEYR